MPTPKNKTAKRRVKLEGVSVADRLGDAPPTRYVWRGKTPTTYTLDGTEHRFDGTCHPDCLDVR